MKRRVAKRRHEAYEVSGGDLFVNGVPLELPDRCLDLCLARHGLKPGQNYSRLPLTVGRHVVKIAQFVAGLAFARELRLTNS